MWDDFKAFAIRGNVVDMAVGIIIGGGFGKIVTSLVRPSPKRCCDDCQAFFASQSGSNSAWFLITPTTI